MGERHSVRRRRTSLWLGLKVALFERPSDRIRRLNETLIASQARSEKLRNEGADINLRHQARLSGERAIRGTQTATPTPFPSSGLKPVPGPAPSREPLPTPAAAQRTLDQQILDSLRDPTVVGPASRIEQSEQLAQAAIDLGHSLGRPATGAELESFVRGKTTIGPRTEFEAVIAGPGPGLLQQTGLREALPEPLRLPADVAASALSPLAIGSAFAAPAGTLTSLLGSATLGEAGLLAEQAGAPQIPTPLGAVRPSTIGVLTGGALGPLAETQVAQRAAQRAATKVGESLAETGGVRALPGRIVTEEAGGTRIPEEPLSRLKQAIAGYRRIIPEARQQLNDAIAAGEDEIVVRGLQRNLDEAEGALARLEEGAARGSELRPSGTPYTAKQQAQIDAALRRRADEAIARQQAAPPAGGPPEPPVPPKGPAQEPPTGGEVPFELPERGSASAQSVIDVKEQTLLRPGKVTQLPGIRQVLSGLNPSVSTERPVLVAANSRQAVQSTLETEWQALRQPAKDALTELHATNPPRYVGPADNPFKNTLKDWGDNPEFYNLTPEHRAAAAAYNATSDQTVATARGQYNVNVPRFPVKDGGFYVPTVKARESVDEAVQKIADSYTSAGVSGKGPRTKTRLYEGAYQRWKADPKFQAETDLDVLTSLHDRSLASAAGGETFKLGVGGKTRLEVLQETHLELASRMEGLRKSVASLRSTAGRLNSKVAEAIDDFLANPDAANLSDLADDLDVRVGVNAVGKMGPNFGKTAAQVNQEIQAVRKAIKQLRPAWDNADISPYILNRKTFRYHQPEESLAIDKILETKANLGEGLYDAVDEVRMTAFGGDVSPLTIQGGLGIAVDPVTGIRNLPGTVRTLFSPDELIKVAQNEADDVRRFTVAMGRPLGTVSPEFVQARKGIERLPGGRTLNNRMMAAVEHIRFRQWQADRNLLKKLNPQMSDEVADAEAANFLSKAVPALNPTERGVSALRARGERLPVISPSFLGGPATFLKDVASGLAKLGGSRTLNPAARWQALSGREQLAVLRGMELTASLTTLSAGSYLASGYSPEEAAKLALNPDEKNGRFLSIAFGKNFYVPIGGPIRSLVRAVAPQKVGEQNGVPIYVPFTNVPQFAWNKVTPPIRRSVELARNRDALDRKIYTGGFPENVLRGVWYGAEGVLPLSAGEVSEIARTTPEQLADIPGVARRVGGQLLGQDVREAGIADKRNQTARDAYGRDWEDLTADEQKEIGPEIAASADKAQILSRLRTIPEFDGITNDERNDIYDFHDRVDEYRVEQENEWGAADDDWKDSAQAVAEQEGLDDDFLAWAITLNSEKEKTLNRNPEYVDFLIENYDAIEKARRESEFYDDNYRMPSWLRKLRFKEKAGAR
mgnify:CR=1 FL=1